MNKEMRKIVDVIYDNIYSNQTNRRIDFRITAPFKYMDKTHPVVINM